MASTSTRRHSHIPPPLPPPPSDLPADYRARTGGYRPYNPADAPRRPYVKPAIEDDRASISPSVASRRRSNSTGLGDLLQKVRSHDIPVVTSSDGHTMLRKQKLRDHEERLRQDRELREPSPPAAVSASYTPLELDSNFNTPLQSEKVAIVSNKPSNFSRPYQPAATMPILTKGLLQSPASPHPPYRDTSPASAKSPTGSFDTRADTLTGRYSTMSTGTVNSPRRMRRKKDPTPFNVLVMGRKTSGKTSLINLLKTSLSSASASQPAPPTIFTSPYTPHYVETDIDGSRIGVTLFDSPGLERGMADLQVREAAAFIQARFEDTFSEESKVLRTTTAGDGHVHVVLLVLDPRNLEANMAANDKTGALGEEDFQVFKGLKGLTTVLPVVSKADTLTGAQMALIKKKVWESVSVAGMNPLSFLSQEEELDSDEEDEEFSDARDVSELSDSPPAPIEDEIALPFSVLTPDPVAGAKVRTFPWGTADPLNPQHCDFTRLKDAVFSAWRDELRTHVREVGYEQWRSGWMGRAQGSGSTTSHAAYASHIPSAGFSNNASIPERQEGGLF